MAVSDPFRKNERLGAAKLNRAIYGCSSGSCSRTLSGGPVPNNHSLFGGNIRLPREYKCKWFVPVPLEDLDPEPDTVLDIGTISQKQETAPGSGLFQCVAVLDDVLSGQFYEATYCPIANGYVTQTGVQYTVYFPCVPIWNNFAIPYDDGTDPMYFQRCCERFKACYNPQAQRWESEFEPCGNFIAQVTVSIPADTALCSSGRICPSVGKAKIQRWDLQAVGGACLVDVIDPLASPPGTPVTVPFLHIGKDEVRVGATIEIECTGFCQYKMSTLLCDDTCLDA